jgi:hypothetical protein
MESAVVLLKSAMSLGAPDPVLSSVVRKRHLEAGKSVVDGFEEARLAQGQRHVEIVKLATQVEAVKRVFDFFFFPFKKTGEEAERRC